VFRIRSIHSSKVKYSRASWNIFGSMVVHWKGTKSCITTGVMVGGAVSGEYDSVASPHIPAMSRFGFLSRTSRLIMQSFRFRFWRWALYVPSSTSVVTFISSIIVVLPVVIISERILSLSLASW